jgi:hypothetical protein
MDEDDFTPPTQPSGALVTPPNVPPTALALASPAPLRPRQPRPKPLFTGSGFDQFVSRTLDMVDDFADTVAEGLGLRPR